MNDGSSTSTSSVTPYIRKGRQKILYHQYTASYINQAIPIYQLRSDILLRIEVIRGNQGRSQPPWPASQSRVGKSSIFLIFPQITIIFFLFFFKLCSFSSSFWPSGWATRPPGKALATRKLVINCFAGRTMVTHFNVSSRICLVYVRISKRRMKWHNWIYQDHEVGTRVIRVNK